MTGAELAERIRSPDESHRAAADRVRHWTTLGILSPIGKRHPGTGKTREYSDSEAARAIVINALVAVGLPASRAVDIVTPLLQSGNRKLTYPLDAVVGLTVAIEPLSLRESFKIV